MLPPFKIGLNMEAVSCTEISANIFHATHCHIAHDSHLSSQRPENFEYHIEWSPGAEKYILTYEGGYKRELRKAT
jgi:hypothetical protein